MAGAKLHQGSRLQNPHFNFYATLSWCSYYLCLLCLQTSPPVFSNACIQTKGRLWAGASIYGYIYIYNNVGFFKDLIGDHSSVDVQFKVECSSEEDRHFLYSRMRDWFGSPGAFEQYVRVVLREELSEQLSSSQAGFESFEGFAMLTWLVKLQSFEVRRSAIKFCQFASLFMTSWIIPEKN